MHFSHNPSPFTFCFSIGVATFIHFKVSIFRRLHCGHNTLPPHRISPRGISQYSDTRRCFVWNRKRPFVAAFRRDSCSQNIHPYITKRRLRNAIYSRHFGECNSCMALHLMTLFLTRLCVQNIARPVNQSDFKLGRLIDERCWNEVTKTS